MEGVGGWAVPLTESLTVEDLAITMAMPVIIVAANRLGMLNHTLLTVEAVRESGLQIAGVVVNNGMGEDSELKQWNVDDIRRWVGPSTTVTTVDVIKATPDFKTTGIDLIKQLGL
jgi:dethiobiotin synthetase